MLNDVEYDFDVLSITQDINSFDFVEAIERSTNENTYTVFITPFDDLRESFDRLTEARENTICITAIGLIDVVSMMELAFEKRFNKIEFLFVTYSNFDMARKNMINLNPVLEKIDHINSFMISRKFEQFRHSIAAVAEFFFFPEMFYHVYHSDKDKVSDYASKIKDCISIKIVNIKGGD